MCTNALCSAANMIIMFHEASRGGEGRGVKDKGGEMGVGRDLFIGPENVRTEFYLPASRLATSPPPPSPRFFAFGAWSFFMASKFFTHRLSVI